MPYHRTCILFPSELTAGKIQFKGSSLLPRNWRQNSWRGTSGFFHRWIPSRLLVPLGRRLRHCWISFRGAAVATFSVFLPFPAFFWVFFCCEYKVHTTWHQREFRLPWWFLCGSPWLLWGRHRCPFRLGSWLSRCAWGRRWCFCLVVLSTPEVL